MVGALYLMLILYLDVFVTSSKDCPEICRCLGNFVDCSKKNLVAVPPSIPKWTTHLNLNNNQITKLTADEWTGLSKLTEIKLNRNNISTIPIGFFEHQKRIEILELNQNKLKDIDALTFKHLEHVKTLKLKRNRISQLKDGAFFGLSQIKLLLLDYNKIKVISKGWLYGLNSLKRLSLSNNNIERIETDAWEFCDDLLELDLSFNRMTSIKVDTFKYLKGLEKLNLNNNEIKFIKEEAFTHLPKLQLLQLNYNEIAWTIEDANGVFSGLTSLTKFHLAFNNIQSINKNAFVGLQNLELLNLSGNNITSVQKNAFEKMQSLAALSLNTTSLLCDCNVKWFVGWLTQKQFSVKAVCSYPDWLRGMPLLEVPEKNFTCDALPKPRLIEQPEPEIMALKGENICLSCKAVSSSAKPMTFQWKKDNKELSNADISVSMVTRDGKNLESISELNIYKVQHSDAGKYQCVVSNSFGTTYSQKSNISVLIFPTFKKIPTNVTVRSGETARLECASDGEPLPEIAWQKDGGNDFPAARERRMHVMPTDDVFFIVNAKPSDTGIYSCTAHNAAGTIVANASLFVEELPSFVKPMGDKEISAGDPVIIQCRASGSPKPVILWLKDGQPINVTDRHFFTAEDQLMIIVNTKPSDSGIYQCYLKNSLGNVTDYSHVSVKVADLVNTSDVMGIVIIAVVCCAVATSVCWVVIIYHTRKRIPASPEPLEFTDKTMQFVDNTSDSSSCKDSGTGDSAKHSNEDLGPEEFTLIIKETEGRQSSCRAASLVYLEGTSTQSPLLEAKDSRTNHDRVEEEVKAVVEGVPFADDSDV